MIASLVRVDGTNSERVECSKRDNAPSVVLRVPAASVAQRLVSL